MTTTNQYYSNISQIDLTPLITYQLYGSLKLHFSNKKYDFKKYGINTRTFNENSYVNRPDMFYFNKISQKVLFQDRLKCILIPNLYKNSKMWIGEVLSSDSIEAGMMYRKYTNSISNSLSSDLNKLILNGDIKDVSELYSQNTKTNYFSMLSLGKIQPITASILNNLYYTKYFVSSPLSFVYNEKSFYLKRLYDLLPEDKVTNINQELIFDMIL